MIRFLALAALAALTACGDVALPLPELPGRRDNVPSTLPAMKTFATAQPSAPARSNANLAQDILDLTFQLESGRELPVLTRFEGPVTLRVTGNPPPSLNRDLARGHGHRDPRRGDTQHDRTAREQRRRRCRKEGIGREEFI